MAEFKLYGLIGPGDFFFDGPNVTANDVSEFFESIGKDEDVRLYFHSPGGVVAEANAIVANIRKHVGKVDGFVDGLAASAASYVALECDTLTVSDLSEFMIHDVMRQIFAMGSFNAADIGQMIVALQKDRDEVDAKSQKVAQQYAKRAKLEVEDVRAMMKEQTMMGGKEILDKGFATNYLETPERGGDEMKTFMLGDTDLFDGFSDSMLNSRYVQAIGDRLQPKEKPAKTKRRVKSGPCKACADRAAADKKVLVDEVASKVKAAKERIRESLAS